mgnify:CR=1 FL=1
MLKILTSFILCYVLTGCDNAVIEQTGNQGNNKHNQIVNSRNSIIQNVSQNNQINSNSNIQVNLNFKLSPTRPLVQERLLHESLGFYDHSFNMSEKQLVDDHILEMVPNEVLKPDEVITIEVVNLNVDWKLVLFKSRWIPSYVPKYGEFGIRNIYVLYQDKVIGYALLEPLSLNGLFHTSR